MFYFNFGGFNLAYYSQYMFSKELNERHYIVLKTLIKGLILQNAKYHGQRNNRNQTEIIKTRSQQNTEMCRVHLTDFSAQLHEIEHIRVFV